MAFQVSPGVNVTEIDKTERVSPAVTSDAAIAAGFKWGPVDKITTITSERDLVAEYGKPDNDTAANWLTASSFLAYGGTLQVIRTAGTDAKNGATSTTYPATGTVSILQAGDGYSVATVGGGAGTNLVAVGTTVDQVGGAGLQVDIDSISTNGGIITGVSPAVAPSVNYAADGTAITVYAAVTGGDGNAVIKIVKDSGGNAVENFTTTVVYGGTGYATGVDVATSATTSTVTFANNTKFDVDIETIGGSGQVTNASLSGIDSGHGLEVGDLIVVTGDTGSDDDDLVLKFTGTSSAVLVKNEDEYDAGATLGAASFLARYAGALGNSLRISVFHDGTFSGWSQNFTQNGATVAVDYSSKFDREPGTSNYVKTKNGGTNTNDEIHVVVVDTTGDISGIPGTILEKYAHVSLVTDAKDENGNSNYYQDVIRRDSKYIYATGQWDQLASADDWEGVVSSSTNVFDTVTTEGYSLDISGGVADNSGTGANSDTSRYTGGSKGYGLLRDTDTTDVGIVISGDATKQIQQDVISNVAEYRKDVIAVISPASDDGKTSVIGTATNETKATALDTWQTNLAISSSYAVADSGYKRMYDAYNDVYRDVPLNGDIAGLMVRTENNQDAWWSPAGFTRG
ncbi:MAG: hypothetical protein QGH83_08440, partial [Candidatus Pacebacteria bacterium]|nr:hypothetical protein [Candidatus Paceibacterota bacterium]